MWLPYFSASLHPQGTELNKVFYYCGVFHGCADEWKKKKYDSSYLFFDVAADLQDVISGLGLVIADDNAMKLYSCRWTSQSWRKTVKYSSTIRAETSRALCLFLNSVNEELAKKRKYVIFYFGSVNLCTKLLTRG